MSEKTSPIVVTLSTEIFDADNDELLIVREHEDIPGLIQLKYDIADGSSEHVSFTIAQAIDVGAALIYHANMLKERERKASLKGPEIDRHTS